MMRPSRKYVAVWDFFVHHPTDRFTIHELAQQLDIPGRTMRAYVARLLDAGMVERWEIFPGYLYRLAPQAKENAPALWTQLEKLAPLLTENASPSS